MFYGILKSGQFYFELDNANVDSDTDGIAGSAGSVDYGEWAWVMLTYDGDYTYLYHDGVEILKHTRPTSHIKWPDMSGTWWIGSDGENQSFVGDMAVVLFDNRAQTPDDIWGWMYGYHRPGIVANSIGVTGSAAVNGNLAVTGTSTFNGGVTIGDDAADTVNVQAGVWTGTNAITLTVKDNTASALSIGAADATDLIKVNSTTNVEGVTMSGTLGVTGDVTFGGNIVADADEAKAIFAAVKTAGNKITLGGGGTVKTAGDLEVAGGDIVATTITDAANVFATTTGKVSVGSGPVNITGVLSVGGIEDVEDAIHNKLDNLVVAVHGDSRTYPNATHWRFKTYSHVATLTTFTGYLPGGTYYQSGGDHLNFTALNRDGTIIATGAYTAHLPSTDANIDARGYVRVWKYENSAWSQMGQVLWGPDKDSRFGSAIDLSDDGLTMIVGAPWFEKENYGGAQASRQRGRGRAQVYNYDYEGGSWVPKGSSFSGTNVSGDKSYSVDRLGHDVSISSDGETVALGALQKVDGGPDPDTGAGYVAVYNWNGTTSTWVQVGSTMHGLSVGDAFGYKVKLSADASIVAATSQLANDSKGNVRVHTLDDSSQWQQSGLIEPRFPSWFGYSLSLSSDGNTMAIGHPYGTQRVSIYTYSLETWTLVSSIDESLTDTAVADGIFGFDVSLNGNGDGLGVVSWSPNHNGYVRYYKLDNYEWGIVGDRHDDFDTERFRTINISRDGSTIAVGAQDWYDSSLDPPHTGYGRVTVFDSFVFTNDETNWFTLTEGGSVVSAGASDSSDTANTGYVRDLQLYDLEDNPLDPDTSSYTVKAGDKWYLFYENSQNYSNDNSDFFYHANVNDAVTWEFDTATYISWFSLRQWHDARMDTCSLEYSLDRGFTWFTHLTGTNMAANQQYNSDPVYPVQSELTRIDHPTGLNVRQNDSIGVDLGQYYKVVGIRSRAGRTR